jgi:hypothetical protein
MREDKKLEKMQISGNDDVKARMLVALAKKQCGQTSVKSAGPSSGSKVGVGQTAVAAPKLHRRKAGSA